MKFFFFHSSSNFFKSLQSQQEETQHILNSFNKLKNLLNIIIKKKIAILTASECERERY